MKLIKGKTYYYIGSIGVIVLKFNYYNDITKKYIFYDNNRPLFEISENLLYLIEENKDLAQIIYNNNQFSSLQKNIDYHKDKFDKYINELENLNKKQEKLKEQYPEEFI